MKHKVIWKKQRGNWKKWNCYNTWWSIHTCGLEIPELENIDQLYEGIKTSTLKAIVNFRKHPSKKATNDSFANRSFSFSTIEEKDVSLRK